MKKLFRIFVYSLMATVLLVTFVFIAFNLPVGKPHPEVQLGMTYSYRYAEALGLDAKETLTAQLTELGIKKWRIPVYWDLVESEKGKTDYSWVDWQLDEIEKYNGSIILSIGQRVPRWPECHIPSWADNQTLREQALLEHLERTVLSYKDRKSIIAWQVENEPFLTQFGECPPLDPEFLESEIALVKRLDPARPVLVTDSGELSLWVRAAKRGDIFGTTLYRFIYTHNLGGRYFDYPINTSFFHLKTLMVKLLTQQENFIVIELQAEPWAPGWLVGYPLSEQFKTMDETKLLENVEFAKRLGFPTIYLWGGEWWYYVKEKLGYPGIWETGKEIFKNHE